MREPCGQLGNVLSADVSRAQFTVQERLYWLHSCFSLKSFNQPVKSRLPKSAIKRTVTWQPTSRGIKGSAMVSKTENVCYSRQLEECHKIGCVFLFVCLFVCFRETDSKVQQLRREWPSNSHHSDIRAQKCSKYKKINDNDSHFIAMRCERF